MSSPVPPAAPPVPEVSVSAGRALRRFLSPEGDPRGRRFAAVLVLPVFLVYLATTSWEGPASPDTFLNGLSAHTMAKEGTVHLDPSYEELRSFTFGQWIVEADGDLVSLYPPGAALHAVPLFALAGDGHYIDLPEQAAPGAPRRLLIPEAWPSAATAVLVATTAILFLGLTLRQLAPAHHALAAGYVAAFATSTWTVAADELWQHGAAMMWIAIGGWAVARGGGGRAALANAATIVVRPLTAVIVVFSALWGLRQRRSMATLLPVLGIFVGTVVVVAFNAAVFGEPSLQGGYGSERADSLLERPPWYYVANFAKGLFAPRYGLLTWSPFLVLLLPGLPRAWRVAPDWVRTAAVGGAAYLCMSWVLEIASAGDLYLFYRYPLEPLTAAAPLLFLAYREGVSGEPRRTRVFWALVACSALAHAVVSPR